MRGRLKRMVTWLKTRGLALYPFQLDGVWWLVLHRTALLGDVMGLGKTVMALLAALVRAGSNAPLVVVCPSCAKGTWELESAHWRPDLRVTVLTGRGSFRWAEPGEIVIINYDILPPAGSASPAPPGTILIADEAHYLKSPRSQRTRNAGALVASVRHRDGWAWALTATPLLNEPPELRTILSIFGLAEEAGLGSWSDLLRLFRGRRNHWGGHTWGQPDPVVAINLQKVMLRRLVEQVLPQLPSLRHQDHLVDVDASTRRLLDRVMRDLEKAGITLDQVLEAQERAGTAHEHDREGRVRFDFSRISAARAALALAKVPALMEFIASFEAADEPLVVFSAHRAPIDALAGRDGWGVITGDVPASERARLVASFQAGDLIGIAATIQAGGTSVTLTRASNCCMVDLAFVPALNEQAIGRIRRIGSTADAVVAHCLVARHPLDQRVNEILTRKSRVIQAVIRESSGEECPASLPLPALIEGS